MCRSCGVFGRVVARPLPNVGAGASVGADRVSRARWAALVSTLTDVRGDPLVALERVDYRQTCADRKLLGGHTRRCLNPDAATTR